MDTPVGPSQFDATELMLRNSVGALPLNWIKAHRHKRSVSVHEYTKSEDYAQLDRSVVRI